MCEIGSGSFNMELPPTERVTLSLRVGFIFAMIVFLIYINSESYQILLKVQSTSFNCSTFCNKADVYVLNRMDVGYEK